MKTKNQNNVTRALRAALLPACALLAACGETDGEEEAETVELACDALQTESTIENLGEGVDYFVPDGCVMAVGAPITIEPGVTIEFGANSGIKMESGALTAVGTAEGPIVMRGATPVAGSWRGLFVNTNDARNQLEYVTIEHAGGESFNSNGDLGAIVLWGAAKLSLKNSTIAESAAYGLNANYGDSDLTFEANTLRDNESEPMLIGAYLAEEIDAASVFEGNGKQRIFVKGGGVAPDASWDALSVPYFVAGVVRIGGTNSLSIEPGAEVRFDADTGIAVEADGAHFRAIGTMSDPIKLIGDAEAPGSWRGLFFESASTRNELEHVEIAYAGGGAFNSNGDVGAIIVWADSYLSIADSTIRDTKGRCGINARYSDETIVESGNDWGGVEEPNCQTK